MADTPMQAQAHAKLRQRWAELEFDGLAQDEKEAIALFWLEAEVMNGGLIQFFTNSSGDLSQYVSSGLFRLGCATTLALFNSALAKFPAGTAIADRDARNEALRPHLNSSFDPFDEETDQLQLLPEDFFRMALDALSARYAVSHV